MYCKHCGTAVEVSSKFCRECGQRIEDAPLGGTDRDERVKIGELIYTAHKCKELGSIDDAILACQGALALDEENAKAHALLGSLHQLKGDTAAAVREYERAVELDPTNAADRQQLEDLQNSQVSPPEVKDKFDRLSPYAPYAASIAVTCVVLVVLLMLVRGQAGRVEVGRETSGRSQNVSQTPPAQPYGQAQYPPGEYQPQAPSAPPAGGTSVPEKVIPPVPLPKAQESAANQARTSAVPPPGPKEPPVIVPVIEPSGTSSPPSSRSEPSGSAYISSRPAPPAAPPAPSVDSEQRGLQLQRAGRYQDAISAYREALARTSDKGRLYQQIALCYQRLGEHDMAVDSYDRAIRSYREQSAAGRDQAEVERNIKACEAGIQVSRSKAS